MILSSPQKQILEKLLPLAEIAAYQKFQTMELKPRTHTLICAPSGAGKRHLIKELGKVLGVPVLLLNVSSWQPMGSRCDTFTWSVIVDFLEKNDRGIIVLDELDKLAGTSDWHGYIRLEIHDLLDGVIPASVMEDDELW